MSRNWLKIICVCFFRCISQWLKTKKNQNFFAVIFSNCENNNQNKEFWFLVTGWCNKRNIWNTCCIRFRALFHDLRFNVLPSNAKYIKNTFFVSLETVKSLWWKSQQKVKICEFKSNSPISNNLWYHHRWQEKKREFVRVS